VQAPNSFTELLAVASDSARQLEDDGVLSLAMPLAGGDPMVLLPHLDPGAGCQGERSQGDGFRFLWDGAPGLCLAASGRCNSLELSGPRRFELAQRFASASLSRLATPQNCPPLARPRVLLAFGFFDAPLEQSPGAIPGVQAVLPRWQLSRQGLHCWLRLQRPLGGEVTARSLAEELWEKAQALMAAWHGTPPTGTTPLRETTPLRAIAQLRHGTPWEQGYRAAVEQAMNLVNQGDLQKLVLAVRQDLSLDRAIDPLELLAPLRRHQSGSCRFLWQRAAG
jgi:menaquinone-specific isochorismate synthase